MPTPIEYALPASNVYGRSNDVGSQNLVKSVKNTLPMLAGWSQLWT